MRECSIVNVKIPIDRFITSGLNALDKIEINIFHS